MYDVDMDSYDDDDEHVGHDTERKRTLSEHEAVVEHQLKRLKINHYRATNSSSPMSVASDEHGRPDLVPHHAHPAGTMTNATECDVNYAYVNQLLREMHRLRELRKQQQDAAAAMSPPSSLSDSFDL